MRQIFPPWRRQGDNRMVEIVNDKERTNAALANQLREGIHTPAVQCACGTWHTPGQEHVVGDTGDVTKADGLFFRRHRRS